MENKEVEFIVNDHFNDFIEDWNYKFYFLVGGYGSSKSFHVASKIIHKLWEEVRLCLVVREVYDTMRDSCFSLLEEVAERMGLGDEIRFKTSPMQIIFPNGSKIIFKGMDKPQKLKSINGVSIIWLEECSEVKYEGYKELLGRLRHMDMSNHIICSTNPVSETNWTYKHFFKDDENKKLTLDDKTLYENRIVKCNNTYYHHSVCDDNYFLPKSYIDELEKMKEYDVDLYRVARKGQFGVNGTKVFPQFEVMDHEEVMKNISQASPVLFKTGMDFGYEISYNAISRMAIDHTNRYLYIFEEYYTRGKTDPQIADDIAEYRKRQELIKADCAEPKAIKFYKDLGFNMRGCKKFKGSRNVYTKKVKRFKKIICSTNCPNHIKELKNLTYKIDSKGNVVEDDFNIDPHTLSSIWYGLDDYEVTNLKAGVVTVNI